MQVMLNQRTNGPVAHLSAFIISNSKAICIVCLNFECVGDLMIFTILARLMQNCKNVKVAM